MRAEYKCTKCGTINNAPDKSAVGDVYFCHQCGSQLPPTPHNSSDNSAFVGLIGGAMLGASVGSKINPAIGGLAGAIVGGVLGAALGKSSKDAG